MPNGQEFPKPRLQGTANENRAPPAKTISLTDLAAAMGVDEDSVIEQIGDILARRVDKQSDGACQESGDCTRLGLEETSLRRDGPI